jgi:hypothetical protein
MSVCGFTVRDSGRRAARVTKLQKKAPDALKSLDAKLKSALRPAARGRPIIASDSEATQTEPRLETPNLDRFPFASLWVATTKTAFDPSWERG